MQTMPIDRLKPAKYNPRKDLKPGDPAYEKIKRSLHDFGYVDPIVWNEVTGNIVGGHQRFKVLKAEGATEVDCVVVHIENPSDEKALNIALNKATGDWEPMALADLLQDLQSAGYDLGATGFDAAEVDDLFSKVHDKDVHDDDCEIDPETVNVYVQPGDIWTLGRHRMMCGDSTSPEAVDALMDGIKANLVVTDPPTTWRMSPLTERRSRTTVWRTSSSSLSCWPLLRTWRRIWLRAAVRTSSMRIPKG